MSCDKHEPRDRESVCCGARGGSSVCFTERLVGNAPNGNMIKQRNNGLMRDHGSGNDVQCGTRTYRHVDLERIYLIFSADGSQAETKTGKELRENCKAYKLKQCSLIVLDPLRTERNSLWARAFSIVGSRSPAAQVRRPWPYCPRRSRNESRTPH